LEPQVDISNYGSDRLFVYFRKSGACDKFVESLRSHNIPALSFQVDDLYDLGAEFYRWEIAIAVACAVLQVNPFDQPDVQLAKTITYKKLDEFKKKHKFEEKGLLWEGKRGMVFGQGFTVPRSTKDLSDAFELFLKKAKKGDFIAINAFVPRNPETVKELQKLRKEILLRTKKATTLGFGPRYLHSTGQMHKGGANIGVIIEITHDAKEDVNIPDLGLPFSVLEKGQALGELETLRTLERRVIRINTNRKLGSLLKKR
jgi:transaldolase / glucose-6-phosphate isomerase